MASHPHRGSCAMWMGIRKVSYPALLSIMLVKLLFPELPKVWAIKLSLYLATGVVVLDLLAGILRLPQRLQQQPKEAKIFAIGATLWSATSLALTLLSPPILATSFLQIIGQFVALAR